MIYSPLGKTGLKVSRITLGSNNFGRQLDAQQSYRVIRKAADLGINSIDTANVYTGGESERIIGEALHEDRDSFIVATKVGIPVSEGVNSGGLSRKHIFWQLRRSLERLQTGYVDLYYLHRPDPDTPLLETMKVMTQLVREGKVLYIGCSNYTAEQLADVVKVCRENDLEEPVALQLQYNLAERSAEKDIFPLTAGNHWSTFTYSPLMGGALTAKYSPDTPPPPESRASHNPRYWERIRASSILEKARRLSAVAESAGVPAAALALKWILQNQGVTSVVLGASQPSQLESNCSHLESEIPANVLREAAKAFE